MTVREGKGGALITMGGSNSRGSSAANGLCFGLAGSAHSMTWLICAYRHFAFFQPSSDVQQVSLPLNPLLQNHTRSWAALWVCHLDDFMCSIESLSYTTVEK